MKLKRIILNSILMGVVSFSLASHIHAKILSPKRAVLVESVKTVGFAAPDYVGVYKFQVLNTGEVQSIDNKGKTIVLASLAPILIQKLTLNIDSLPPQLKLITPDRPRCADAPGVETFTYSTQGVKSVIRTFFDCVESLTENATATQIAQWLKQLENTLKINSAWSRSVSRALLLGQEGYGSPSQRDDQPNNEPTLYCEDVQATADDGFALQIQKHSNTQNEYTMVIQRTLLTGPKTEEHAVKKQSSDLPEATIRYRNHDRTISLDIEIPSSSSDGSMIGQFQHSDRGILEQRNLICHH